LHSSVKIDKINTMVRLSYFTTGPVHGISPDSRHQ